jgi:type I restriction-modification system DNA methylase subunit
MSGSVKEVTKAIEAMTYGHDLWQIWCDFNQMAATSLANAVDKRQPIWKGREEAYLRTAGKYKAKELDQFAHILAMVVNALEAEPADVLGQAYMQLELGNKWAGQFFTPDSLCYVMSKMTINEQLSPIIERRGFATVQEPSCGGGATIIGLYNAMRDLGYNPQTQMHVTAIDIDIKSVHMAYIQFSLLGIPAVVIHGNTLKMEEWSHWYTPAHILFGWNYKLRQRDCPEAEEAAPTIKLPTAEQRKALGKDDQITLF